jgi:[protein-PII] uridylyltransferase
MRITHQTDNGYSASPSAPDMRVVCITGVMAANGVNNRGQVIPRTAKYWIFCRSIRRDSDSEQRQKVQNDMRMVLMEAIANLVKAPPPFRADCRATQVRSTTVSEDYGCRRTDPRQDRAVEIDNQLTELGLYIGVSKISTKVDQVADVFYVRDIFGHKIHTEEKLAEIQSRLISAIDEWV